MDVDKEFQELLDLYYANPTKENWDKVITAATQRGIYF